MTRLEISILHDALTTYQLLTTPVKTIWHSKIQAAIDRIEADVMNHEGVLTLVYRQLSLHSLMAKLAAAKLNLLAIGRQNLWLITTKTSHKQQFIGSQLAVGLTKRLNNKTSWSRIQTFAMRYACLGSSVNVYYIAEGSDRMRPAAVFNKVRVALY